jgi:hypothetical protein
MERAVLIFLADLAVFGREIFKQKNMEYPAKQGIAAYERL